MRVARFVEASTAEVGEVLTQILATVVASGAEIHPDARLREADGSMSVHCVSADTSHPLIRMPRDLLVPIDGASWADSVEELRLESAPEGLSAIQRDLLDMHVALYNATRKIPWVVQHHPSYALRTETGLVDAIRRVRPGFGDSLGSAAETLIATRAFWLKPVAGKGSLAVRGRRVLLPIVDLMNHHPAGAVFEVDANEMTLAVARAHSEADECYASYGGRRDVLDLALHYGYLDMATSIVRSAPVGVALEGVGMIEVAGESPRRIHPLDPPRIETVSGGLRLSHLTFDGRHPGRARTTLGLAVRGLAIKSGLDEGAAAKAAHVASTGIIAANVDLLGGVVRGCTTGRANEAMDLVRAAALRQSSVLHDAF